ncbi:MAG: PadR family transcriptional regulator [Sphingobium sp.]
MMHFQYHHRGRLDRSCSPFGPGGRGRNGFGGRHGGPEGNGGFGGRGGRRRLFDNDALKLAIVHLLSIEPRHGYDLIREIGTLSGDAYAPSPGVVYPTLTLLADMELIAEVPSEGSRKLFAVTDAGIAYLADNADALASVLERLASMAKRAERTDGAPIRRAMHNLTMALRARLEKEGADAQTMFDVASLIDEAASKIERL